MSSNWLVMTYAGTSCDLIFLIVGLHNKQVQIPIDAPGHVGVFIHPDSIINDRVLVSTSKSYGGGSPNIAHHVQFFRL